MEEEFKKVIEDIKKDKLDPEETKKYILKIKKVFRKAFDNCKEEYDEAEILQMCMEQYNENLKFRGNARGIFNNMLMYDTYKKLLSDSEHNKASFRAVVKEAKKLESENSSNPITSKFGEKEFILSGMRYILRKSNAKNEKEIIEYMKKDKNRIAKDVKPEMIRIIQSSVGELEEYGILDEYIEISNKELANVGLEDLRIEKRNPIPDEQYKDGELIENVEDIGLLDSFSSENLENMSVEDLEIMTAFYESKYLQERIGLSKAMSTIKTLDLWDTILYEDDKKIENLDNATINNALKKDLALTYLCKNGIEVTPKIKRSYKKFLKETSLDSGEDLKEEIESAKLEVNNLGSAAQDIGILECLLVRQLKEKYIKMKRWGVVKDKDEENVITIAMENERFRGPLLIDVPENILIDFLGKENLKFPEYKGDLDKTYCDVMSRLYLPANKYYESTIKKMYNENPQSKFIAGLAGKKVKEGR